VVFPQPDRNNCLAFLDPARSLASRRALAFLPGFSAPNGFIGLRACLPGLCVEPLNLLRGFVSKPVLCGHRLSNSSKQVARVRVLGSETSRKAGPRMKQRRVIRVLSGCLR